MSADADIVADLYEIVDLGALADDRIADGAAIDGGAGADLDVVLNNNRPTCGILLWSGAAHDEAKAILPDIASGMDNDPIADQGIRYDRTGADGTITADPHPGADHGLRPDRSAAPDFGLRPDRRAGLDRRAVFHACTDINMRSGKVTGLADKDDGRKACGKIQRATITNAR